MSSKVTTSFWPVLRVLAGLAVGPLVFAAILGAATLLTESVTRHNMPMLWDLPRWTVIAPFWTALVISVCLLVWAHVRFRRLRVMMRAAIFGVLLLAVPLTWLLYLGMALDPSQSAPVRIDAVAVSSDGEYIATAFTPPDGNMIVDDSHVVSIRKKGDVFRATDGVVYCSSSGGAPTLKWIARRTLRITSSPNAVVSERETELGGVAVEFDAIIGSLSVSEYRFIH